MRLPYRLRKTLAPPVIWRKWPETGTPYNQRRRLSLAHFAFQTQGNIVAAKIAERIGTLEERLKQLKAKQQRVEARKRTLESRRTRRDDTRRKILVGAIVLAKVEQGVIEESVLRGWLKGALTRPDDRSLFGLSSRESQT